MQEINEIKEMIDSMKISDMVRITSDNSHEFMQQVADHVDKLEDQVAELKARIEELDASNGNNTKAQ